MAADRVSPKRWGSDVIVDLLHAYELPYAALNPGASYRGLHDSIVNYGANKPYMMLCQHEETAVQIAHGYAKVARAYSVMMTEPRGPIYVCYDAWLQEQPLEQDVALPPAAAAKFPARIAADPASLEKAAQMLLAAKQPVLLAEYVGRDPEGFHALVELAETLGAPVYDVNSRLNFPSRHPLNLSMVTDVFRDADLVLCLDTRDWERPTTELVSTTREVTSSVPPGCKWIDIGFGDLELSSWAMDYQRRAHADLRIMADTDAGRLVVDLQPDGDLMFDAGALWVAAKHRIPLLVVMYNNRAYYNDWEHQIRSIGRRISLPR